MKIQKHRSWKEGGDQPPTFVLLVRLAATSSDRYLVKRDDASACQLSKTVV